MDAETYRDYKTNQVLATKEASVRIDARGNYRGLSQMKDIRLGILKEALHVDKVGKTGIETEFEKMRLKYLPRMDNLDSEYDNTIEEEKLRVYMYIGDEFGIMKLWDLSHVIQKRKIEPCRPFWEARGD